MSLTRACVRRCAASALRPAQQHRASTACAQVPKRTAATAASASNLPDAVKRDIQRQASLPNPDPAADSQTARLVNDQLTFMVPTYVRPPPMFQKAQGCYLWDVENRQYLDFMAGIAVNALGHADPDIAALLFNQASTLIHTSNLYHNPWTGALSKLLVEKTLASGAMHTASKSFICNSGSEANEAALKFARKCGKMLDPSGSKSGIVSFHGSFHGRTMGALSATPNPKYQKPFAPMVPGFSYGEFNNIASLPQLVNEQTCGVIIEPIQGEGGVNVATPEFLAALRQRCDAVGAVLIYDEIQCGLSRTGQLWAHGALPPSSHPDILTTAKALGNGFPIGATLVNESVASKIVTGDHGTTFGGNPLGCRVAHHIVSRLSDPQLQHEVIAKEQIFRSHFARLQQRFASQVGEVRGRGLILGLQLHSDPTPIVTAARERGLLVITCGTNTLRFVPPLVISEQQIKEGMDILEQAMETVFAEQASVSGTKGQQEMQDKGEEKLQRSVV